MLTEPLCDGGDDARVETATQQHTVGHIGHQLTLHGLLQRIVDSLHRGGIILHGIVLHPVTTVVPLLTWVNTPIIVARQEWLITLTLSFERLQL